MNAFLLNLLDRIGWTFAQALGGVGAAGATAASLGTSATDWRPALVGGLTAAVLCALKVLGVSVSQKALAAAAVAARAAGSVPVVHNAVAKVEGTAAGAVAADVVGQVAASLALDAAAPPVVPVAPVAGSTTASDFPVVGAPAAPVAPVAPVAPTAPAAPAV